MTVEPVREKVRRGDMTRDIGTVTEAPVFWPQSREGVRADEKVRRIFLGRLEAGPSTAAG